MANKKISKQAQAKLIQKRVTKTGEQRFFKAGKRLPNEAGRIRFKNQQIALNRFRFGSGRFVGKDVQSTIVNNPVLKDLITNKVLTKNPDFFDVNDNETALEILDAILQSVAQEKKALVTLIENEELHPREDFKFKANKPIDIWNFKDEINALKPSKRTKLKVIKLDGSEVIGKDAMKYLDTWNKEKFEEIKKRYPDAVGGVIKYPHKYISPYLIIDLRLIDDKDIDVFDSEPKRRGQQGERVRYNKFKGIRLRKK